MKDRIIIALDVQNRERLDFLIQELKDCASYVKVGMELFYTFGPEIIKELKENGFKVFLDLKIHDIPNTAKHSCKTITKLGVDIINLHASGGIAMMKAGLEGVNEALAEDSSLSKPLIIGVTQLTSTDQNTLNEELLIQKPIHEAVTHYAKLVLKAGLDGVVSSPLEVKLIKTVTNKNFKCITPGIRPKSHDYGDQKRVTTPKEAFENGSDFIVIGRSITKAESPKAAFNEIMRSLE